MSHHTSQFVEEIRDDIYSILNEAKKDVKLFSLTTDLWSDYRGLSYCGLTVHWCDNEFNLHKLVPFVVLMEEKHTGKNLSLRIAEYITKLGLDSTEIKLVMTLDNASNNKVNILNIYNGNKYLTTQVLMRESSKYLDEYFCGLHTLALVIKDVVNGQFCNVSIKNLINKCTELAAFLRKSKDRRKTLENACKETNVKYCLVVKPNSTRWNSQHDCLQSVIRLKPAL